MTSMRFIACTAQFILTRYFELLGPGNFHPMTKNPMTKTRPYLQAAAAVFLGLLSIQSNAAGDATAGEIRARGCMGCHAIEGYNNVYPTYHVPRVGGQNPEYIMAALNAYKSGMRQHKTMQAQAASLTDEDIANIAAYFASLKQ